MKKQRLLELAGLLAEGDFKKSELNKLVNDFDKNTFTAVGLMQAIEDMLSVYPDQAAVKRLFALLDADDTLGVQRNRGWDKIKAAIAKLPASKKNLPPIKD